MFKETVRGIRNLRTEMNVPAKKTTELILAGKDETASDLLGKMVGSLDVMNRMTGASKITVDDSLSEAPEGCVSVVCSKLTAYIPLDELVDTEKEKARLEKEKAKIESEIKRASGMLSNPGFVNKAPEAKINAEREKLAKYEGMLETVESQIAALENR